MKIEIKLNDKRKVYSLNDDCDLTLIIRNGKVVETLEKAKLTPSEEL